ncbi:MAG: aminotransferase class I/II-fold pyridoxal phosphate-dependent enzyme, partial [Thermogutta sp.]|nr:aminotransferase class I/II-fold pyridoxal phosphate-dependent enzyme [Thermogutta sp.]
MKTVESKGESAGSVDAWFRPNIRTMEGYTPGEQPQEGGFIKLNTNENPYPPSPRVEEAIREVLRRGLQKYPDPLATAFRVAAGTVLGFDPDWILAGNGSDDILTICTRAFVGAGHRIRYPYPSYLLYGVLGRLQEATVEEVMFQPDWSLPEAFILPREDLRLCYLPNPNSPSGTMIRPQAVEAMAERLPCPLLVDEAYADFAEDNCLDSVRRCKRILVSRTLSKSYALAGLRFGFLIAHPDIIRQLRKVKDSYNCDSLSIAAATAAIEDRAWLRENRAKILATRARLAEGLAGLGFDALDSQANFVWCTHR